MVMRTDFDIALIKVTKSFDDLNRISHPFPPMDLNIKAEIPPMGSTVNGWLKIRSYRKSDFLLHTVSDSCLHSIAYLAPHF